MIVTLWRIVGLPEVKGERNFTIPHLVPWKLQSLLSVQGASLHGSRSTPYLQSFRRGALWRGAHGAALWVHYLLQ